MNPYLSKIDSLLETNAPLKKFNEEELQFLNKLWITKGLENRIKKKNNIYSKTVKNFISAITRPTETSYPQSWKEQNKNISLTFLMKTL